MSILRLALLTAAALLSTVAVAGEPTKPPAPARISEAALVHSASGLRSFDLVAGTGREVLDGSRVTCHYAGWLVDGTPFDASYDRETPFEFTPGQGRVIPGWEEGVLGMREGGVRQLVIPPELGYGDRGAGSIPPFSTLIFELRVIEVAPPLLVPAAPASPPEAAWVETPSGLRWADLVVGTGEPATDGWFATTHYTGWLEDGSIFDSSEQRGTPITYPHNAGRMIAGWEEGLEGMCVGGRRVLVIPYELGYGERGRPPMIPPRSTLIFEVSLVKMEPAPR